MLLDISLSTSSASTSLGKAFATSQVGKEGMPPLFREYLG
jgi:hypothetical protein